MVMQLLYMDCLYPLINLIFHLYESFTFIYLKNLITYYLQTIIDYDFYIFIIMYELNSINSLFLNLMLIFYVMHSFDNNLYSLYEKFPNKLLKIDKFKEYYLYIF